jgi:signal recognition particle subunit SRP54
MFDTLSQKLFGIFSRFSRTRTISEQAIADALVRMHDELLAADVPYAIAEDLVNDVKREVLEKKVSNTLDAGDFFIKIIYDRLVSFLSAPQGISFAMQKPPIRLLVMGLQGAGKTTSITKIAHVLQQQKINNIMVTSLDYTRPTGREQLALLAKTLNVPCYQNKAASSLDAARTLGQQRPAALLIDTAGSMHINERMIQELREITTIVAPTYRLLVLDGFTGQEALSAAQTFEHTIGIDGIMLTKMDGNPRAGAALACARVVQKPIVLIGTGERAIDYEFFQPERIAKRILGIGDLESLLERVKQHTNQHDHEHIQQRFLSGNFTLDDFAQQLDMMQRIGSLGSLMRLLPRGVTGGLSNEQLTQSENSLRRFRVIIDSMNKHERCCPALMDKSRIARVAKGAGVCQAEVKNLLAKFEESKQFAKLIRKNGLLGKFFN